MKRIIMSAFIMLTTSTAAVLANDGTDISNKAKQSFKIEFAGAQSVEWKNIGDYYVARFVLAGYPQESYFTTYGELAGVARFLVPDQLPLEVRRSLDKHFAEADFTNVQEIYNTEGTSYWATVETKGKQYRVKADTYGNIESEIKIAK